MYTYIEVSLEREHGFGKNIITYTIENINELTDLDLLNDRLYEKDLNLILYVPYGNTENSLAYFTVVRKGNETEGKRKLKEKLLEELKKKKENIESMIAIVNNN